MYVKRMNPIQPANPQKGIRSAGQRPIQGVTGTRYDALQNIDLQARPDMFNHSDHYHAMAYWVANKLMANVKEKQKANRYGMLVATKKTPYKRSHDPTAWKIEDIHYTMATMLADKKYAKLHNRLARHLWQQVRSGKSIVSLVLASAINKNWGKLSEDVQTSIKSRHDVFDIHAKTTHTWWTSLMREIIGEGMTSESEFGLYVDDFKDFYQPDRVKKERVIHEIIEENIKVVEEEVRDTLTQILEPDIYVVPGQVFDEFNTLEEAMRARYEELVMQVIETRVVESIDIKNLLGIRPVHKRHGHLEKQQFGDVYNFMRTSLLELFFLHDALLEKLPMEPVHINWVMSECSPKDHMMSWHYQLTRDGLLLRDIDVFYFARLGLVVLQDERSGREELIEMLFDRNGHLQGYSGTLFGSTVLMKTRVCEDQECEERIRLGDWQNRNPVTFRPEEAGTWGKKGDLEKRTYSSKYAILRNAQHYYLVNKRITLGNWLFAIQSRYHFGVPLPLGASGIVVPL